MQHWNTIVSTRCMAACRRHPRSRRLPRAKHRSRRWFRILIFYHNAKFKLQIITHFEPDLCRPSPRWRRRRHKLQQRECGYQIMLAGMPVCWLTGISQFTARLGGRRQTHVEGRRGAPEEEEEGACLGKSTDKSRCYLWNIVSLFSTATLYVQASAADQTMPKPKEEPTMKTKAPSMNPDPRP